MYNSSIFIFHFWGVKMGESVSIDCGLQWGSSLLVYRYKHSLKRKSFKSNTNTYTLKRDDIVTKFDHSWQPHGRSQWGRILGRGRRGRNVIWEIQYLPTGLWPLRPQSLLQGVPQGDTRIFYPWWAEMERTPPHSIHPQLSLWHFSRNHLSWRHLSISGTSWGWAVPSSGQA